MRDTLNTYELDRDIKLLPFRAVAAQLTERPHQGQAGYRLHGHRPTNAVPCQTQVALS